MLNCIYHFTGNIEVVEDEEMEAMLATGAWFDHPSKAKAYREELSKMTFDDPKPKSSKKVKGQTKEKDDEKSSNEQ